MKSRAPVMALAAAAAVVLPSCGKEMGRVPLTAPGTAESTLDLKAGEVAFWTDIDVKYEGNASMAYVVELSQGGAPIATATCNPLGSMSAKVGWTETNLGSSHTRSGSGKMDCSATLAKGGATKVKATLSVPSKPNAFTLTKADLVVKQ